MRLLTFVHNGQSRIGAVKGEGIVDLQAVDNSLPGDMVSLLQGGDAMMAKARSAADRGPASLQLNAAKLQSPVVRPPRILAVGLNYLDHFYEIPAAIRAARGMTPPTVPVVFNKQNTSANGPYDALDLPAESSQLDYEGELALVIGKTCRRVSRADAFSVIAGYTVLNDATIRDWQMASPTMTMGKSWDSHCPMGPVLVTPDELEDPQNLNVKTTVDGELRQSFNTSEMIFGIADQIAHLSTAFTLLPGDVIATGTSAGVAIFSEGQPWLKEGQVVRVEIDQIGYIENVVARETETSFIR